MWKWVVVEWMRRQSEIILLGGSKPEPKTCWNFVFLCPFDPADEQEQLMAFQGCQIWLEKNRVDGSKYLITEMYFDEPHGN